MFLDLVEELTGKPLTGEAWIAELREPIEQKVQSEKREYDGALVKLFPYFSFSLTCQQGAQSAADETVDLNMRILIKDGDELIVVSHLVNFATPPHPPDTIFQDSAEAGGFLQTCAAFEEYIQKRFSN